MNTSPAEKPDLCTLKADLQSGDPQNIASALDQVWELSKWQAMSSPERQDLVRTVMAACEPVNKINAGYWQQIAYFMMELEPDFSLDLLE